MKESEFATIINEINNHITVFEQEYKGLQAGDYTKSLTIDKYNHLINISKINQAMMDRHISDFYHLIGMGNLNCCQISRLSKIFKKYLSYRSHIKFFANKAPVVDTQSLKVNSEYKLTCGIKLQSTNIIK